MAKKENTTEVTGGLTSGLDFNAPEPDEIKEIAPRSTSNAPVGSTLTEGYQQVHKRKIETRSAKMNILVKPSTAKKLDDAVNNQEIRSKNDLINYLLEKYFEEDAGNRS